MGCNKLGTVKKWIPYDNFTRNQEPYNVCTQLINDDFASDARYTGTSSPCREQLDHIVEASSKIQKEKKESDCFLHYLQNKNSY